MTKKIPKIYLLSFIIPLSAIIWRILYRQDYYPGWDTIGAANGLFLLKNYPLIVSIKKVFIFSRNFQYWTPKSSIIFSLIPGAISAFFPWEFWPHFLVFLVFVLSLWLSGISFQFKDGQWAWLALALGSSSTLLSFSVCGYPYISGMLPHSIALLIIFHPYFKKNWCCGLLLGFLTIEVSWHVYELGKTIFIPFFLAAFFQNEVGMKKRGVHFILGTISVIFLFFFNVGAVVNGLLKKTQLTQFLTLDALTNLGNILKAIFWEPGMDLPVIPILGLTGLLFLRKNRLLFAGILLSQWLLFLLLGFIHFDQLRPRRFLIVDFYSVVVLLLMFKQWWPDIGKRSVKIGAYILIFILIIGNIWQFINLKKFTSIDIRDRHFGLPYTFSRGDYYIMPQFEDAANILADIVNQGKKIILIYNYYVYQENRTNPEGLLERLYLKLGHEKFKENIFIFSKHPRRYSQVPIIPISKIDTTLNGLMVEKLNNYFVFMHTGKNKKFKSEVDITMKALKDKFNLEEQEKKVPLFIVYKIFPL